MSRERSGYWGLMDSEASSNGHLVRAWCIAVIVVLCAASVVRLLGVGMHFLPRWIALLVAVFACLEILSVGWNILRGEPSSARTFFDRISDVLVYLPWP